MISNSECTRHRLSAELRSDPLGELTALPETPIWIWEGPRRSVPGRRKGRGEGDKDERGIGGKGERRKKKMGEKREAQKGSERTDIHVVYAL